MATDSIDFIRRYVDAFNRHDADACATFIADDGTYTDMVSGRENEGPAGLREWVQQMFTSFPDGKVELLRAGGSEDIAVSECVFRGTHQGPLVTNEGEIPPTGKEVEIAFCTVGRLRDDKMVSVRQYYDGLALFRQLGLIPGIGEARAQGQPQAEADPYPT